MGPDGWFWIALVLTLFRYVRLIVNCVSHWSFRPTPIPAKPTYFPDDVTIILPTIATGGDELERTLETCLATDPHEVLLVTVDSNVSNLKALIGKAKPGKIRVLSIGQANKRRQLVKAIPEVQTRITVFVDDDVIWPPKVLQWMLAPFEDPQMGGVGTSQRLKRAENMSGWGRIFGFLGAAYLERRNFDCSACLHIDGGLPCLSGRTVAYRTSILQEEPFGHEFTHETWRNCQLNADDDNFITRWLWRNGWKMTMQYHRQAEVQTTLEPDFKYIKQCLRWIRSNWRSNTKSLWVDWKQCLIKPWTTYAVLQTTWTANSLLWDPTIIMLWSRASQNWSPDTRVAFMWAIFVWIFAFSKTVKLWGHYIRYPTDVVMIVPYILFGYIHCLLKLWGLFTLSTTDWGSRDGADADNAIRMISLPKYESAPRSSDVKGRASETFDIPRGVSSDSEQLPAYEHPEHESTPLMTACTT